MNIALSAIFLILLLTPGAVIIRAYYSSFKEKKNSIYIPFNDLIFKGIVYSIVYHFVAVLFIKLFGYEADLVLLYNIISGNAINLSNSDLNNYFLLFALYYLIAICYCYLGSKLFKKYVQQRNYDLKFNSLRNTNYWYEIFSARFLENTDVQGEQGNTALLYVDALTTDNVIYSGFLIDFNYSPHKDQLENIILQYAVKRNFAPPSNREQDENGRNHTTGPAEEFPGEVFILPAINICNFNVFYIIADKTHG